MKRLMRPLLEAIAQALCTVTRSLAALAHKELMRIQWGYGPTPEHFDHHIDVFYAWLATRNSMGWERGVFSGLVLKGGDVLELACGDGFNARNFYSLRSKSVLACDFDPSAIRTAKRKNLADNVTFMLADIRTAMPAGIFENIIWDAAIEHFTPDEIGKVILSIKQRLPHDGILSGYTLVEAPDKQKALSHHEYEFKSKEDLERFLTPHFHNVIVFETIYPVRHNLYFWASDGPLPFQAGWPHYTAHLAAPRQG
jgi:SAM-dependent methyltransferase